MALERAAAVCRILAFGSGHLATDDTGDYAHLLVQQARTLLRTADELGGAARLEHEDRLD